MAVEGFILLVGIIVLAITLLIMSMKLNLEDGGVLNVLFLIFSVLLFLLVPKIALDYDNHCEIMVSEEVIVNNTTSFSHEYVCFDNEKTTATSFYLIVIRLAYALIFYGFIYGIYKLYQYISKRTKWQ